MSWKELVALGVRPSRRGKRLTVIDVRELRRLLNQHAIELGIDPESGVG